MYSFTPIGRIRSCFRERFGTPRQPGLAPDARAVLDLFPPADKNETIRGLDVFSHIWLIFVFHDTMKYGWRPTVRPPRMGGNRRTGVFATRSNYRPNPLGLSAVRLNGIRRDAGGLHLDLSDIDILDGTPVLDIKPCLPWTDNPKNVRAAFAAPEATLSVSFSARAEAALLQHPEGGRFRRLIIQVLGMDPRPAYRRDSHDPDRRHGIRLMDRDVRFQVTESQTAEVTDLLPLPDKGT
ncbi:MAG: tRNA (N6-threonylcarbamoyladenosine(37)-N6)-methyltransferase TrmO [Desulfobacterales bacterium]|nr:MAG: tRNA (N6-threonylcarbamoyladenosine(37)-N6)-methyltransferase TrmO [Desulfobacterales bacterium]